MKLEKFIETLTAYRKYVYEFALSDDIETYDRMIDLQVELVELYNEELND